MRVCDSRVGEDVVHFLVGYVEYDRDRLVLLDDVCIIVRAREWLDEFCSGQGRKGDTVGKRKER